MYVQTGNPVGRSISRRVSSSPFCPFSRAANRRRPEQFIAPQTVATLEAAPGRSGKKSRQKTSHLPDCPSGRPYTIGTLDSSNSADARNLAVESRRNRRQDKRECRLP